MGKIEQNKEKKRHDILVAAQEIFLSDGYEHTSMDKIAALARVTKQTIYRYFPSKVELFQDTLIFMGKSSDINFVDCLQNPDTQKALYNFARYFMRFHLSDKHIATYRLLVAEGSRAPEIANIFHTVGSDDTRDALVSFFSERLKAKDALKLVRLWTGMLLSSRADVLIGIDKPSTRQIDRQAKYATEFLLDAVS